MAISKQQPMRPAEAELVDAVNALDTDNTANKAALESLQAQIGDGFEQVGTTVTSVTNALSRAVQTISEELGDGFDAENTVTDAVGELNSLIGDASSVPVGSTVIGIMQALQAFQNRFRVGSMPALEIEAGQLVAGSVTYNTPYAEGAELCVQICCTGESEVFGSLECVLISSTYSGFSYAIRNNDTETHTVGLAFVSTQVN